MNRLWHRIRHGHKYDAWPIYFGDTTAPAWACRTCLKRAHVEDERPHGKAF